MADKTKIEWTDATWNPITGCAVVSPGCTNCYAMKLAGTRLAHHESRAGLTRDTKAGPVWTGEVRFNEQWLDQPLRWKKPRMIFVCAHGDLFAEGVQDDWLDQIFAVMALAKQHNFQILTKRPDRMQAYLTPIVETFHASWEQMDARFGPLCADIAASPCAAGAFEDTNWPLPNVWLGVSVEDQRRADERIPVLLETPAALRWISAEPLLGSVDISRWTATAIVTCKECRKTFKLHEADPCQHAQTGAGWTLACPDCGDCRCDTAWTEPDDRLRRYEPPADWIDKKIGRFDKVHPTIELRSGIDWVVSGGESGADARPSHPNWHRKLRDQCAAAGVPFLFKQWGEWVPQLGSVTLDDNPEQSRFQWAEWDDGRWEYWDRPQWCDELDENHSMIRCGKRLAGRHLDGKIHNDFPEART